MIPGLGRSAGEEKGYSLQYSGLENSMDWIVHGVAKTPWTRVSDFTFTFTPLFKGEEVSTDYLLALFKMVTEKTALQKMITFNISYGLP